MALFLVQENLRRESAPTAAISGACQFSFGNSTRFADLPEFDIAEHLDSEQARAEYLTVVLEENDPAACAQKQRGCRSTLWSEARKLTQVAA